MVCNAPVKKGEKLVAVPRRCWMTSLTAKDSNICKELILNNNLESWQVRSLLPAHIQCPQPVATLSRAQRRNLCRDMDLRAAHPAPRAPAQPSCHVPSRRRIDDMMISHSTNFVCRGCACTSCPSSGLVRTASGVNTSLFFLIRHAPPAQHEPQTLACRVLHYPAVTYLKQVLGEGLPASHAAALSRTPLATDHSILDCSVRMRKFACAEVRMRQWNVWPPQQGRNRVLLG